MAGTMVFAWDMDSRAETDATPNEYKWLDDLTSVPKVSHAGTGETKSKVKRQKAKSRPDRVIFMWGKCGTTGQRDKPEVAV